MAPVMGRRFVAGRGFRKLPTCEPNLTAVKNTARDVLTGTCDVRPGIIQRARLCIFAVLVSDCNFTQCNAHLSSHDKDALPDELPGTQ
jgi:hypothetical protein